MAWSFNVASATIREALDTVKPAVAPGSDRGCFVRFGGGAVEAVRDDLRITVRIPGSAGCGPVLLNHARLVAALRECEGDVQFAATSGEAATVTLRGTGGKWQFPVGHEAAWPRGAAAKGRPAPVCRLPADQLARCLIGTIDAAGDDAVASRPHLAGLRIDVLDGTVSFVAMDGRRMYVTAAEIDQSVDDGALSVPVAAARVMLALAHRSGSTAAQLVRTETAAVWTVGSVTVSSPLLAGTFIPWRKVIPHRGGARATVGAGALLLAVRQAEVVTSEESRAVAFRFAPGRVSLAARSVEYGSAAVACPAVGAALEATLRLDPRHVRQWLATLDGEAAVSVDPGDGKSPVLLRHEDAVAVVLPMAAGIESFAEGG